MATLKAATDSNAKYNSEEGFFSQLANEVLDSAEKLTNRLEEGLNAIFTGEIAPSGQPQDHHQHEESRTMHDGDVFDEEFEEDSQEFDWSQMDMDSESPLSGLAESVVGDILQSQSGPRSVWESLDAFRHAINWTEPVIIGILVFQVIFFLSTIWVSRPKVSLVPRVVLMVTMAGLVRSAEWLNRWASRHWQDYGITQNYFDQRGIFISIFLCAPLLLNSFIMLLCFLREAALLLVQVKTAELKQKRKKQLSQQQQGNAASTEGSVQSRRGKKDQ